MPAVRDAKWEFIMWSALAVYLAVWIAVPILRLGESFWPWGVVLGTINVASHAYEITQKGHCFLSADSTAAPATFLALFVSLGVFYYFDAQPNYHPFDQRWLGYCVAFGTMFMGGHLAAIAYSALIDKLLPDALFRGAAGGKDGMDGEGGRQGADGMNAKLASDQAHVASRSSGDPAAPLARLRQAEEEARKKD